MEKMTIYIANGKRFDDPQEALAYEKLCEQVDNIIKTLTPRSKLLEDGCEYYEHDLNVVKDCFRKFCILCSKVIPSYKECCFFLHEYPTQPNITGYKYELLHTFRKLLICRDTYWKIAGDELGLGKSWKPDWNDDNAKYSIYTIKGVLTKAISCYDGAIFVFPTAEMRDAFKENFDPDIEICKELL